MAPRYTPVVVVTIEGLQPAEDMPWRLQACSHLPIAMGRFADETDRPGFDPGAAMVECGLREHRLIACFDQQIPPGIGGRDNILVTTGLDPTGTPVPRAVPVNVIPDLEGFDWTSPAARAAAGVSIFTKYLPDLVVMRLPEETPESVCEAAAEWLTAAESLHCCVAFVSPPVTPGYRGWFAVAGDGVVDGRPVGITPTGFAATLEVLSGMGWVPSILDGVPAVEALRSDLDTGGPVWR